MIRRLLALALSVGLLMTLGSASAAPPADGAGPVDGSVAYQDDDHWRLSSWSRILQSDGASGTFVLDGRAYASTDVRWSAQVTAPYALPGGAGTVHSGSFSASLMDGATRVGGLALTVTGGTVLRPESSWVLKLTGVARWCVQGVPCRQAPGAFEMVATQHIPCCPWYTGLVGAWTFDV